MTITNQDIQKAIKEGRYIHTKKDGKLVGIKPKKGQIAIFQDLMTGVIIREPNGVGHFSIQLEDGSLVHENICTGNVVGLLSSDVY